MTNIQDASMAEIDNDTLKNQLQQLENDTLYTYTDQRIIIALSTHKQLDELSAIQKQSQQKVKQHINTASMQTLNWQTAGLLAKVQQYYTKDIALSYSKYLQDQTSLNSLHATIAALHIDTFIANSNKKLK